ncbi:hypothetical protein DL765_000256 [Monosporascus sp. GIB2]|nr:hypothetical protein DL765_000256 [Monosporascus sp. GIB2]
MSNPQSAPKVDEVLDVAIIGAGWYGLKVASIYVQLEPATKLALFDRDNTVGGTWSRDRIYPNLVAQVEYGYFNYPSTPMPKDGATNHNLVTGDMIFKYLDKFAGDTGVKRHIRFNSWVSDVQRCPRGWRFTVNGNRVFESAKLIVAVGVTSIRNSPTFEIKEDAVPVIHSIDIARNVPNFSVEGNEHFLVIGAAKSAYDVVYLLTKMGKKITWVIRPNGSGPMPIMPAEVLGKNTITMGSNRFTSYLSPSLMTTDSALGSFFHRTSIGRWFTRQYWRFISSRADQAAGFGGNAGSVEGLRPDVRDSSCFWCDSSVGLITMDDFWSTLKKADINIIRDNVETADSSGATLRSGQKVDANYIIYCTGWGDHFSFFSPEMKKELGIPPYGAAVPSKTSATSSKVDEWYFHDRAADDVVAKRLPLLAAGPKDLRKPDPNRVVTKRRWRLYNRCVPLATARENDRSLVILGQIHTTQTPTISEVQSLWAVAYLLGEVDLPSEHKMIEEVAQWNAWVRKRYLGVGERYPYALFDWIAYLDRLLGDLGVETQRKASMLADFFSPYGPHCYTSVVDEYKAVRSNGIREKAAARRMDAKSVDSSSSGGPE